MRAEARRPVAIQLRRFPLARLLFVCLAVPAGVGCSSIHYVSYSSSQSLTQKVVASAKVEVEVPDRLAESRDGLVRDITDDFVKNVFSGPARDTADILCRVHINTLSAETYNFWYLLPVFFLTWLGSPVGWVAGQADVSITLSASDGLWTKVYDRSAKKVRVCGLWYNKDYIANDDRYGRELLAQDALAEAMGKLKQDIERDRVELEMAARAARDRMTFPQGRPLIDFTEALLDGSTEWTGASRAGFTVTVENKGNSKGNIDISLTGSKYLLGLLATTTRSIGDIDPGQIKNETFTFGLPLEPPEREETLYVEVSEKLWGASPTKKEMVRVALLAGSRTIVPESLELLYPCPSIYEAKRSTASALIVGISNYETTPLKYARRDAQTFRDYAERVLGVSNIETLFDAQATSGRFRSKLENWLKTKQGFKVVYFAGHGMNNPENLSDHTPYLVPADYDGTPTTLLSTKEIPDLCSTPSDTLLLVYDACISGGTDRPIVAVQVPITSAITLAAADSSQPSKEFDKAQHGYFTYYTLLGLKGKADEPPYGNGDGWVTTTELYNYVRGKVSHATNNVQVPVLRPEREIRLGRYR